MKYDTKIREEELKHRVAVDWFAAYDCTRVIGNIDFAVDLPATELALGYASEPALWAEAKAGARKDIAESFVQLILTIGRARFANELPPLFLGAFDAEKIAFIPYNAVLDVLGTNDFNWNVTPSDHETKEFKLLYALASDTIAREKMLFDFERDAAELKRFIRINFRRGREDVSKLRINKNNFTHIYRKWREAVYPFIDAPWEMLKKNYGIYDRDFYLAEINVDDKDTPDIADDTPAADFYISFRGNESQPYWMKRKDTSGLPVVLPFGFKPGGLEAYAEFWRRYKRPPKKEYWSFIVKRLDLLVPQDVRERKGSFFTPKIWVEKSQQYLANALGENWQDEYYIWDCAGGTGNMEVGLTNKYNVFVSTLDQQDVDVIHQTFGDKGAQTLLDSHVFQFDFLNDSFDDVAKVPAALRDIINDSEKRKKLVIYINPPYAEHSNRKVIVGTGDNRTNVAKETAVYRAFSKKVGTATRELYVQFFLRIASELSGCVMASFSTLKFVCSQNCAKFREYWKCSSLGAFICPAYTFDNVAGAFPIAFSMWRLDGAKTVDGLTVDVMGDDGALEGTRDFHSSSSGQMISDWLRQFYDGSSAESAGYMSLPGVSMQQRASLFITSKPTESDVRQHKVAKITQNNLLAMTAYLAVRHCIEPTWLNNKDEFRCPIDDALNDASFLCDCLVYSMFDNSVKSEHGPNHWIPFTEAEVGAHERFASHFMTDFMRGHAGRVPLPTSVGPDVPAGRRVTPVGASVPLARDQATTYGASEGDCGAAGVRALPRGASAEQEGVHHSSTSTPTFDSPLVFSPTAQAVLAAGRELWRYYHSQPDANPNASYYDIRAYFQGRKPNGTMNATSADETYNAHLDALKKAMKQLAKQIEPKVYDYGFLKR